MRERRWLLVTFAFFVLLTLWLTWPLAPRMSTGLSDAADARLNVWALGWNFHILATSPTKLFDANIFAPRPDTLAYSEHLFGIAILFWPAYVLSGNLVLTYNLALFASFALSGLGMALLARELTGSRWAAVVAGTIYLAAPYRFGHLLQIQLLSYQWFPFAFWCLIRFLREGGRASLYGLVIFTTLQMLTSNYYAVYLAVAFALFAGVSLLFAKGREMLLERRRVVALLGASVLVGALVAPFILPYERNRERGFYRRYEDVVHFSARPGDYLASSSFQPWRGGATPSERALFPGFAALLLALVGVLLGKRGGPVWAFWIALVGVGVFLSFGPELRVGDGTVTLPYRFLYRHAPGFGGMRAPARFSMLALFGLAVLAAYGAARLLERMRSRKAWLGVALLAVLALEYRTLSLARVFPDAPRIPEAHRWLATAPSSEGEAVLVLPIHEGEAIIHESLYMYFSTVHFKPLVNGYSGWWPNDYWEVVGRLRHFPTARILRFLLDRVPVRYVVIHYDLIPEPRRHQLEAGMARYHERMPVVFRMGNDVVHEIR